MKDLPAGYPQILRLAQATHLRRPVKLPVHICIPQDGLHVFAGFGEGDGLDALLRIAVVALSLCQLLPAHV